MDGLSIVYLSLATVVVCGSIVAFCWRYKKLREQLSARDFIVAMSTAIVTGIGFIGGTPSDWFEGNVVVKPINSGAYLGFLVMYVSAYIYNFRESTKQRRSLLEEKEKVINETGKQNSDLVKYNKELHDSLHNYFHPHLEDLYKFFYEYGNGATPTDFDWGYRRLNLFLFDEEDQTILNLSRYSSITGHDVPNNRFVGFDPRQSYVAKIFNVRNQHTGKFYELDPAWKTFRQHSRAIDLIKYVCGYEIPIKSHGTTRKSLLLLYEFENLPKKYLHKKSASLLQKYIDNSSFPRGLFSAKPLTALTTLVSICKNWPDQRSASQAELSQPSFRLRAAITRGNEAQRAKANILSP